ncbi:MAG: transglutaminase-like domain-containing protein [Planctomycetota bacterium]
MRGIILVLAVFVGQVIAPRNARSAEPTESFLKSLPAGVFLQSSALVAEAQTETIAQRLGAEIDRLTNSKLRVQGRAIQVNAITARTETDAKHIHTVIGRNKPDPFCFRRGKLVIEYVGRGVDEALALKTSFELGLIEKPDRIAYRISAKLAAAETVDYMACNPLFQQFIRLDQGDDSAKLEIGKLSKQFAFADTVRLRNPAYYSSKVEHQFSKRPTGESKENAQVSYKFSDLPNRLGIPYIDVAIQVIADKDGLYEDPSEPRESLTASTKRWPANNEDLRALAGRITQGKTTNEDKVQAILEWLKPGAHIRYRGQTGSRWGTEHVFKQGYGHCWDFSDCFVTLARAAGVPSRQVAGWLYGSSGHVWAEYFREGVGWQQVDPTGGGELRCGIYHIPYFSTEDGEMPVVYLGMPTIERVTN